MQILEIQQVLLKRSAVFSVVDDRPKRLNEDALIGLVLRSCGSHRPQPGRPVTDRVAPCHVAHEPRRRRGQIHHSLARVTGIEQNQQSPRHIWRNIVIRIRRPEQTGQVLRRERRGLELLCFAIRRQQIMFVPGDDAVARIIEDHKIVGCALGGCDPEAQLVAQILCLGVEQRFVIGARVAEFSEKIAYTGEILHHRGEVARVEIDRGSRREQKQPRLIRPGVQRRSHGRSPPR